MSNNNQINNLLHNITTLTSSHKKLAKVKGEDFNVFSILKMERKENDTHSAFLRALLNPKGKHYLGAKFLELFIIVLKQSDLDFCSANESLKNFESNTADVNVEFKVGDNKYCTDLKLCKGNKNCQCSGGRIDIYLKDKAGNIISIENKIDAIDQPAQLKRYYNHKTIKNCVVYLNKHGSEPNEDSSRGLNNGEDYIIISYADHIIKWLELCLKETANQPILRETIKQYIILIKKITNTVTNDQKEDLKTAMFNNTNIEAAKLISQNYLAIENEIKENFREAVFNKLKNCEELNELEVHLDPKKDASNDCSAIWIRFKGHTDKEQFYGIESFSGRGHISGDLYVGIFDRTNKDSKIPSLNFKQLDSKNIVDVKTNWWPLAYKIDQENKTINLSDNRMLVVLSQPGIKVYNNLVNTVVAETLSFINDTKKEFLELLNRK